MFGTLNPEETSHQTITQLSTAPVKPHLHDITCCQTGLTTGCIMYTAGSQIGYTTRFDNRLNEQLFVQHGCQTGLMLVYTIQPVVKPVVQQV